MDFSASSHSASSHVVPTNSPLPSFAEQSGRTRKNKTPREVPGQQRLLRRGRSAGRSVAERSLDVVGDRDRRQSFAGVRTADFAGPNVRFEESDITIDDAEFHKSAISFCRQLSRSYRDLKYLNNPELDRTEFTERVRYLACFVFMCSGCAVTAALMLYAAYALLDYLGPPPEHSMKDISLLMWYSCALILAAVLTPLVAILSHYLANSVAAVVDAYEKKVASTSDESATEQFLMKYDRMESLLDRLNRLRVSTYIAKKCRKTVRDLPKLVVNVSDSGVDGKPLRHVTVEEKPKLQFPESMECSFYFSSVRKNRRKLETAIEKTRNWLDRAEKQVRLIRGEEATARAGTQENRKNLRICPGIISTFGKKPPPATRCPKVWVRS